jgi:HEAT repeat protein
MDFKNSIWFEAFSSYARVCARSIFLQITLISLLFFIPAFGASPLETAVGELKSADSKMQYDGLEKIKLFHTPEAAQAVIQSALRGRDANFRLAALDQIAAFQLPAAVPGLAPFLNDKTAAVRQRAARVIGMLGGAPAEALLAAAAAKENDPSVKAAVMQALGFCGSSRSDAILNAAAVNDPDPAVRANAVHARQRIQGGKETK